MRITTKRTRFAAGIFLFGLTLVNALTAATSTRPNILFIMADDHGRQAISAYGSKTIQTPNLDRLAGEGMRFTEALATNAICSPSRAVLLTGKYNHLCGVAKLSEHFDGTQQTFPKLLQQAGYQTAIVGKWHLWSEPTGFDYYCVAPANGGRYYDPELKETGHVWGDGNKGGEVHPGYMTDVITDVSLAWLKKRDTSKPFCLMIHHKAPHAPHDPAPRHKDLFKGTVFPEPANLLDEYQGRAPEAIADKLVWSRMVQANPMDINTPDVKVKPLFTGNRTHDTRLAYQAYMRGYLSLVATLDEDVGRVLDYLEQSGLAANTIVIYTSDNGFFEGEHGFFNKMWMYEEALHLPLIIHLPGVKSASTNSNMVSMLDVAPTILDLAGVSVPADMQGVSMKPLLLKQPVQWRDAFYYHYYGAAGATEANWIASHEILGVRTKDRKLVYYPKVQDAPFWEYFDLTKDPTEMHNLYHDAAYQEEIRQATNQLHQLMVQYRDEQALTYLDKPASRP